MVTHDVSFPHTTTFFECDVFSLNGSYVTQLHLLISDDESVISESNTMTVEWSSDYKLHVPDVPLPSSGFDYNDPISYLLIIKWPSGLLSRWVHSLPRDKSVAG